MYWEVELGEVTPFRGQESALPPWDQCPYKERSEVC